jgi:hypothetical protein
MSNDPFDIWWTAPPTTKVKRIKEVELDPSWTFPPLPLPTDEQLEKIKTINALFTGNPVPFSTLFFSHLQARSDFLPTTELHIHNACICWLTGLQVAGKDSRLGPYRIYSNKVWSQPSATVKEMTVAKPDLTIKHLEQNTYILIEFKFLRPNQKISDDTYYYFLHNDTPPPSGLQTFKKDNKQAVTITPLQHLQIAKDQVNHILPRFYVRPGKPLKPQETIRHRFAFSFVGKSQILFAESRSSTHHTLPLTRCRSQTDES